MIRLYPAVVRSEENIQDLKRTLGNVHGENLRQCDQLTEAALRIRELGAELGKADFDRRDRLQDYQDAWDVTKVQLQRYADQLKVRDTLQGELAEATARQERQLMGLSNAEMASKQRWDVLLERELIQSQETQELFDKRQEEKDLTSELAMAEDRWKTRFGEYGQHEMLAEQLRWNIREASSAAGKYQTQSEGVEKEVADWTGRHESLAAHLRGLQDQLDKLQTAEADNIALSAELKLLSAELKKLQDLLSVKGPESERLHKQLDMAQRGKGVLTQVHESERADLSELEDKLAKAKVRNTQLEADLELAQQGGQDMKDKATSAKALAQRFENERQGQLDRLTKICAELNQKVTTLQKTADGLTGEILIGSECNGEKQKKLDVLLAEQKALEEAIEQTDKMLERERNRCRCVVM
mmetsp:Transcript_96016/g.200569  ORF Transcript_96016/g.200569 Transcript_96016/m.200569 type:complete len:413 (-) Transcript_96016:336-1574(-)|eukprot:CAMPEP_0206474678 /NCGR_PEP_ID=MMETSP0324_2-20121206/33628_1 /ASSEMBLY_ACC=CAM_ASM_000836 /TAXON_ID=2866 /ORGANISM="Crypthecodinium cohnii, Strain Seligo" /LENGTH=412 /DNA_ID=CAMNT_0053949893 /DNA_START=109 /DNA_END=1347 /DNA_ORIENTATION=-